MNYVAQLSTEASIEMKWWIDKITEIWNKWWLLNASPSDFHTHFVDKFKPWQNAITKTNSNVSYCDKLFLYCDKRLSRYTWTEFGENISFYSRVVALLEKVALPTLNSLAPLSGCEFVLFKSKSYWTILKVNTKCFGIHVWR